MTVQYEIDRALVDGRYPNLQHLMRNRLPEKVLREVDDRVVSTVEEGIRFTGEELTHLRQGV